MAVDTKAGTIGCVLAWTAPVVTAGAITCCEELVSLVSVGNATFLLVCCKRLEDNAPCKSVASFDSVGENGPAGVVVCSKVSVGMELELNVDVSVDSPLTVCPGADTLNDPEADILFEPDANAVGVSDCPMVSEGTELDKYMSAGSTGVLCSVPVADPTPLYDAKGVEYGSEDVKTSGAVLDPSSSVLEPVSVVLCGPPLVDSTLLYEADNVELGSKDARSVEELETSGRALRLATGVVCTPPLVVLTSLYEADSVDATSDAARLLDRAPELSTIVLKLDNAPSVILCPCTVLSLEYEIAFDVSDCLALSACAEENDDALYSREILEMIASDEPDKDALLKNAATVADITCEREEKLADGTFVSIEDMASLEL